VLDLALGEAPTEAEHRQGDERHVDAAARRGGRSENRHPLFGIVL
jgi:hypothetical protein